MSLKIIYLIIFVLIANPCFAEKYYLLINKNNKDNEYEKGDVVSIMPFSSTPTRTEKQKYLIKIVDLTKSEREQLVEPEYEMGLAEGKTSVVYGKPRKRKLDIDTLKQEKNLIRNDIFNKISVKSRSIVP